MEGVPWVHFLFKFLDFGCSGSSDLRRGNASETIQNRYRSVFQVTSNDVAGVMQFVVNLFGMARSSRGQVWLT